jgi:hypothetical protein
MGIESPSNSLDNTAFSVERGAESGAPATQLRPIDPDLVCIVAAWPTLPEPIKTGILALVRAAGG